jgi:hypothetical protein
LRRKNRFPTSLPEFDKLELTATWGPVVLHVKQYRDQAQLLRTMAAKESNPAAKAKLLDLAEQYESLARQRENFLALQEEIRVAKERPDG